MKRAMCGGGDERVAVKRAEILLRIIVTAAFLYCVLFIWHNSMESAAVSAGRSGRVTETVNKVLTSMGKETVTEHFIRKLAHFSEYGLEGVLTVLLFVVYCLKPKKSMRASILIGLFTAVVDESIQFFSAGRAPGLLDVCIDMAGFICGMLFMTAGYYMVQTGRALLHESHARRGSCEKSA